MSSKWLIFFFHQHPISGLQKLTTLSEGQLEKLHNWNRTNTSFISWAFIGNDNYFHEVKGRVCYGSFYSKIDITGIAFSFVYNYKIKELSDLLVEVLTSDESPWRKFIKEAEIEPTYVEIDDRSACVGMVVKNMNVSPQSLLSLAIFIKRLWARLIIAETGYFRSFRYLRDFGLSLPETIYMNLFFSPLHIGEYKQLFISNQGDWSFSMHPRMDANVDGIYYPKVRRTYLTLAHLKSGNIRTNVKGNNLADGRAYTPVNPIWGEFISEKESDHGKEIFDYFENWCERNRIQDVNTGYSEYNVELIKSEIIPLIKAESAREEII